MEGAAGRPGPVENGEDAEDEEDPEGDGQRSTNSSTPKSETDHGEDSGSGGEKESSE